MTEYKAMYKCRFCGVLFVGAITGKEIAERETLMISCGTGGTYGTPRKMVHHCNDGSIGLSEFIGFKKVGD